MVLTSKMAQTTACSTQKSSGGLWVSDQSVLQHMNQPLLMSLKSFLTCSPTSKAEKCSLPCFYVHPKVLQTFSVKFHHDPHWNYEIVLLVYRGKLGHQDLCKQICTSKHVWDQAAYSLRRTTSISLFLQHNRITDTSIYSPVLPESIEPWPPCLVTLKYQWKKQANNEKLQKKKKKVWMYLKCS